MMSIIWGFIQKEFRQTLRDPRMRVLIFLAPCVQLTLFGFALSTEVRGIRLALPPVQEDPLLQDIRRDALASGWFQEVSTLDGSDPFEWIRSGKADAVIIPAPSGLGKELGRAEARLQMLIDASNVTRAQGIQGYTQQIIQRALTRFPGAGSGPGLVPRLKFETRVLYNPSLRSAVYLVPGIMSIITCLITILLTSMSIAREKERGTFETIIAAPVAAHEVILGKTLPYIVLGLANLPLILVMAVLVFDVPMRGSIGALSLASLVFVFATVAIGTLISTITRTQQQAMMGGFLYLLPSILISGLMSPVSSMPRILQYLAYLNPVTYYMELLRNIMLKGGDPALITRHILIMAGMACVLAWLSMRRFRTTL